MAAGDDTCASATFSASEKRASSPPEAILARPPKAAPSTVATSKAIFSSPRPLRVLSSAVQRDAEFGMAQLQRRQFARHRRFQLAGRAFARLRQFLRRRQIGRARRRNLGFARA